MPLQSDFDPKAFLSLPDEEINAYRQDAQEKPFNPKEFLAETSPNDDSDPAFKSITDPYQRSQVINKESGLPRGEWIRQRMQTKGDVFDKDEYAEALEYALNKHTSIGDAAEGAAKGFGHLLGSLKDTVVGAVTQPAQFIKEQHQAGASPLEYLPQAAAVAGSSFLSGAGTTGAEFLRQGAKLAGGVGENVYALAGGKPLDAGTHTGYDSTDLTDFALFKQGALNKEQLLDRYMQRHTVNQEMVQGLSEHANPIGHLIAKAGQKAGLPISDADAEAFGQTSFPAYNEGGALYAFGELNKPAEAAMRVLSKPIGRVVGAGVREAAAFAAPKLREGLTGAANLAGRGAEMVNEGRSLLSHIVEKGGGAVIGAVGGNELGQDPVVSGVIGALGFGKGARMIGLERIQKILSSGAEAAGVAEKMATVAKQFAQKDAPFVKNLVGEMTAKAQAAKAAGNVAEAANLEGWANTARYAGELIRDGVSGQSLFRHVAENAQRLGIDKGIARLALSLDRKPVRWAIEHGIPTAKAVVAGGTLNSLLSIGNDATPEQMAEQFGMGGLAIFGAFGRAAKVKSEGRLADFGRDLSALHQRILDQVGDGDLAKERVGQILSAYDPKTSGVDVSTFLRSAARMPDVTFRFIDKPGEAAGRFHEKDANGNRFMDINLSANRTRTALSDVFGHESGHAVAEFLKEKQPGVWGEFTRSAQGVIDPKLLEQAKREYIALLHHDEIAGKTPAESSAIIEERLKEKELQDPEYFLNEVFADRVADAYTSRDLNRLSRGSRGGAWERFLAKKGIAQPTGSKGQSFRALERVVGNSKLNALAEKALGEYLSPNRFLSDSVPIKQLEKGEKVEMDLNGLASEAFNRAKERNPGQPVNLEFDWGTITEQNGKPVITTRSPKDIRADEKRRLQAALDYAQSLKSTEASGWGKGTDEKGGITFGGGKIPQQFLDLLPQWGYKQVTVDVARDIAKKIGTGEVLKLWNNALTTTLSANFWRKLVRGERVGFKRSQREFVPAEIKITSKGNILVGGWDVKVLDLRIQDWAEKGLLEPWGNNTEAVHNDLMQWLANWKDGKPGETGLGTAKKNVLNALVIGKGRKADTGANPYRDALAGAEAAGTFRTFRLDRIEDVQVLPKTGYHFDYQKAQGNALPDNVMDKDAMDKMKVRYDGRIEVPGVERHQFTIENPESPAHKATFIVRGEPTPESVQARITEKEAQFAEGRALPDDFEAEHIQATPKKPEDPRIIARLLGVHYDGRVEGGDLPAHQYTTQDGKKLLISGTPSLERVREKMQGRALPDEGAPELMTPEEWVSSGRRKGTQAQALIPAVKKGRPINFHLWDQVMSGMPDQYEHPYVKDGDILRPVDFSKSVKDMTPVEFVHYLDSIKGETPYGISAHIGQFFDPEARSLEEEFRDPNKRAKAEEAFRPARQAIRDRYGDFVTLYRAESKGDKPRTVFSYSFSKKIAEKHAGIDDREVIKQVVPVDAIVWASNEGGEREVLVDRSRIPGARALPDSEVRGMYGEGAKKESPALVGARLGLRYEGRVEGGSLPAHQYRDENGKRIVVSGTPTIDTLRARLGRALPEKFWLSPDGEVINNRDYDRNDLAHDKTAQALLKSRYNEVVDDPDEAFKALTMKGFRRGVWHKGTDQVYITEPLPNRAMLSVKQGEALEAMAAHGGYRIDIDSQVKPRNLYDYSFGGGRALPDTEKAESRRERTQRLRNERSGRALPEFVLPPRAKNLGDKMVWVDVQKFDDAFKKDEGYIDSEGNGEISGRRDRFREFLEKGLIHPISGKFLGRFPVEVSEVVVGKNGDVSFINGRHRYSILRDDLKLNKLPVAMNRESLINAKKNGLVADGYNESRKEKTARLKQERSSQR